MHQLSDFRCVYSSVIEKPMENKAINDDENHNEVEHCDDSSDPFLSLTSSDR